MKTSLSFLPIYCTQIQKCHIRMELYTIRMMAINDLVEENVLKLPKDTSKSSLGMHIILE